MNRSLRDRAGSLVAFSLLSGLALAVGLKLDAPEPDRGMIGVRVKVIPPAMIGSSSADAVYFVRIVEDEDRYRAENVIASNFAHGKDVYLLNAKPGRYVAVACMFVAPASSGKGTVFFSKADIDRTEVTVAAGQVVFMGDLVTGSSTKFNQADPAQSHYARVVTPAESKQGFLGRAMKGSNLYTGQLESLSREESVEREFWSETVEKHFREEPPWAALVRKRLEQGAPAQVAP
jgi:hypothetical protein